MAELIIIRASAGSGKTYSLTEAILSILIEQENTNYFKRILAVTFTNKATAEMKSRILEELYLLGSNKPSAHLDKLCTQLNRDETSIRQKSKYVLHAILHAYSWFRIETIDTFFQGVIRSFIRELNIAGYYSIELDQEKILSEAIDRLMDKIGDDDEMLVWLLEYIDSKIKEGKSWVITKELTELGKTLFRENMSEGISELKKQLEETNALQSYRNTLNTIIHKFETKLFGLAEKALQEIEHNGYRSEDFYQTTKGVYGYFNKIKNKNFDPINSYVQKVLDDSDKYPSAKCKNKDGLIAFGNQILNPTIKKIIALISLEGKSYNSASIILKNFHILGVLAHLEKEIGKIKEEKGLFLISDASSFIHKIIDNNDTPFIYEKIGNHFNHLLIDEFQDTSTMQWGNFKPLIENSLGEGNDCLLVGDVKQSIYRWRNSNWEVLESGVKKDLPFANLKEKHLETNWRSDRTVIDFNNHFFSKATKVLSDMMAKTPENLSLPAKIYGDVSQQVPDHKDYDKGYVSIKVFEAEDKKNNEDYFGHELTQQINLVLDKGFLPGDIALLVRNKKEGTILANYIVKANTENKFTKNIGVISNESLFVQNSPSARLIVSAMQFINDSNSSLLAANLLADYLQLKSSGEIALINFPPGKFEIEQLNKTIQADFTDICKSLKQESLYILAERLTEILDILENNSELVYIHSFLDIVFDYSNSELSDLGRFLKFWKEDGHKKTISAAETSGAIKILTIHKSKGLQFPIVIVPFADWNIKPSTREILWLKPKTEPFNKIPSLPVNYSGKLDESIFQEDYQTENYLTLIDNINLLYVAFTRAENGLFAFVTKRSKNPGDIDKLIIESLSTLVTEQEINIRFNADELRYSIGDFGDRSKQAPAAISRLMPCYIPNLSIPKVRFSSNADEFLYEEDLKNKQSVFGSILHSIMEKIIIKDDAKRAIKTKIEEGVITIEESIEITKTINNALHKSIAANWFDGSYRILAEADIIEPGGMIKRPDRVMIKGDSAIVVDYKFGEEIDIEKHKKQVKNYMNLIQETGIGTIEGYVWYVIKDKLVEVF